MPYKERAKHNAWQRQYTKRPEIKARNAKCSKRWYDENRDAICNEQRMRKYGITADEYAAKLVAQNAVCAICQRPEHHMRNGKLIALAVDHNHITGKVRGLLCQKCNAALGFLQDDVSRIHRLLAYLADDQAALTNTE